MTVTLSDAERLELRRLQKQRRAEAGDVQVTVLLLVAKGRAPASIADDLGLDEARVYRYAQAFAALGLARYLQHERPGYWGLLSSAQLAALRQQVNQTLDTDVKGMQHWLAQTYQVHYSVAGLPQLPHRLGCCYKLTSPVPCQADTAAQTAFLDQLSAWEAPVEAGQAVLYYADAAHPTHNTRSTRAWCARGQQRPLLTVSGRERVNLNAALPAYQPTQVLLDATQRVDAQSTRRLYERLLAAQPATNTIYVICDNATYDKNKDLTAWLASPRIRQIFLPPYAPNRNLIERLWKFLRQKIITTTCYRTKGLVGQAMLAVFTRLPEFEHELVPLLTRKFHILNAQQTL